MENDLKRLSIIKEVINLWDPVELLVLHTPIDEYKDECTEICNLISGTSCYDEIKWGRIVYDVFLRFFGKDVFFKSINECQHIARKIENQFSKRED